MSLLVEPRLNLLVALLVKGIAEAEELASATGIDLAPTAEILRVEAERGAVGWREGPVRGWTLTEEGRAEAGRLLRDQLDPPELRSGVEGAYRRFMELNPRLLGVCTRWQVRSSAGVDVVNDHADALYDEAVVRELGGLNEEVRPVLADVASLLSRFAGYQPRLDGALERVRSGERDWFSSPRVDSYHSVWFELHEDLLATLGIRRSDEGEGS